MYRIKTRNYYGKQVIKSLLDKTAKFGVRQTEEYNNDGDVKYWIDTNSPLKAWGIWLYFITLRRWSGGWTYIIRPGKELHGGDYKAIY